jgi:F-type H+-transporting ATPase subunit epsilon
MAGTFKFELVSPERLIMTAEVEGVQLPGAEGDMTILPNHAPLMTTLRPGLVTVTGAGGKRVFVRGGFAEFGAEGLTLLAEQAIPAEELDRTRLESEIKNAEEDLADAQTDAARTRAAERLAGLRELAAAV